MTMKQHSKETEAENEDIQFKDNADICQQLMDRYAASAATQHRHLVATAAAMRSILTLESLPLTPSAYFAAALSSLESETTLEAAEVSALLTFLSVVVALVPLKGIAESKASEAVRVLVVVVEREAALGVASVKCAVKCLGILLVSFCDLEDWNSIKLGFETLLKFSVDKRPKVRRCAQDWLEKVFECFQSSAVVKAASKLIHSLFKEHMSSVLSLSTSSSVEGSKDQILSKPEHQEVLHMFNVFKLTAPYLSAKVSSKILSELCKVMSTKFSPLTRHLFSFIEALCRRSNIEILTTEMESIIVSLASYVSLRENKPIDTIVSASILLKGVLDNLHGPSWFKSFTTTCDPLAGLLTSEASTALQASCILKELIGQLTDKKSWLLDEHPQSEVELEDGEEVNAIKSMCATFESALSSCNGVPNEHMLSVISFLFLRLGNMSYVFMKAVLLKLGELMMHASGDMTSTSCLQRCIGSAVCAMGPERILNLLPISFNAEGFTCSNIWLVPILNDHVVQASLGYYMEHIVPLAKSIQKANRRVKKSVIGEDLQAHALALWGLLPAFCRYPYDIQQKFKPLAELLVTLLKKKSFMLEHIAVALQLLVNQNRSLLTMKNGSGESNITKVRDSLEEIRSIPSYSKKTASRNIKALASCSADLLEVLTDLFIKSESEKRSCLKDAIGCLASITDSSVTKTLFMSLLKRFSFVNSKGEFEIVGSQIDDLDDKQQEDQSALDKELRSRSLVMELASFLVEGASEDLVDLIYSFIRHTFQASGELGHQEAYYTLSKILKEHTWFCSSRWEELIELLFGLKSPADVAVLKSRLACFQMLIVHALKINLDEENMKAFLILNEIILTLKDANEERRKAAYDVLLSIGSSVEDSLSDSSDAPYQKLISMIMGYLSGSSPQIISGAVSALSVLVYKDPGICFSMPDVVSSLLSMLQSKALEVIKAVLGFVKVLVSCAEARDIQSILTDLVSAVLPWSSVSRNHFRSKVTVILEIVIRKCGFAAVESVTPERYRKFVRTVLESRQKKSNAKDINSDEETVTGNSSSKGPHKRKQMETSTLPEENNSKEYRKRRRDKRSFGPHEPRMSNDGGGFSSGKRARHFEHGKPTKGRFTGDERKNNKVFGERSTSSAKRKPEQKNTGRKGKAAFNRPGSASKFGKHRKFDRK